MKQLASLRIFISLLHLLNKLIPQSIDKHQTLFRKRTTHLAAARIYATNYNRKYCSAPNRKKCVILRKINRLYLIQKILCFFAPYIKRMKVYLDNCSNNRPFETEIFISQLIREPFDYTKWQRNHYAEMSVSELNKRAVDYSMNNPMKNK